MQEDCILMESSLQRENSKALQCMEKSWFSKISLTSISQYHHFFQLSHAVCKYNNDDDHNIPRRPVYLAPKLINPNFTCFINNTYADILSCKWISIMYNYVFYRKI